MLKKISTVVMLVMLMAGTTFSFATDSTFTGNKRKGKYLLRKMYKACKKRGEVDTSTPPVSPADKTQAEWKSLYIMFKENKDKAKIDETMIKFKCKKEWADVKPKTRLDIFTYFYKHASDSSTPAKCK